MMTHLLVDHINTGTLTKMDGFLVEQLVTSLLQLISTIQLRNQKYSLNRLKEIFHILGFVRLCTSFKVNQKLSGSKNSSPWNRYRNFQMGHFSARKLRDGSKFEKKWNSNYRTFHMLLTSFNH